MASFVDIRGNYREPGRSQVREPFLPTATTGFSVVFADDDEMARVNEGSLVSSKSPLLVRAGKEEGARKRARLALIFPNAVFWLEKDMLTTYVSTLHTYSGLHIYFVAENFPSYTFIKACTFIR